MNLEKNNNITTDERIRKISWYKALLTRPESGALLGVIFVMAFFLLVVGDSGMFGAYGSMNFLRLSAELGILAVFGAMLMIGGEFDLSIGSMIGFAGLCLSIPIAYYDWPVWQALLFAFSMAILVGFFNGLIVTKTGLPSFVVTLAMLFILRGLCLALTRAITNKTQVPLVDRLPDNSFLVTMFSGKAFGPVFVWMADRGWIETLPDGSPMAEGIPASILWWIFVTVLTTWILLKTKFGNWIFASGGDKVGARNIGVPVDRVKITLFIGTACAATLFACIQVLSMQSADSLRGMLKEFEVIIACVVGGCLLTGGYGSAIGASLGALIFGTVYLGIYYTNVDTDYFKVFLGIMLLLAVLFNNYIRKIITQIK